MGRKIPAKKHRGVKNPLEQQARREKSLKSKINAPPKDPDEQPVPRSLTRLFAFRDKRTRNSKPMNENKRPPDQKSSKERNPVSELKRLVGESGRSFSLRINSAVRALHGADRAGRAGSEPHGYPQDMEAEDVKGDRMAELRARRRRRRGGARAGGGGGAHPAAPAPPAPPPRPEPAEVRYERVQFGDVAHAPPALRLKGAVPGAPRPGRRALLLAPLLAAGGGPGSGPGSGQGQGPGPGSGPGRG